MSGLTASNLAVVCAVGADTCTRDDRKRAIQYRYRHAETASLWTERNLIPLSIEAAGTPRNRCDGESRRERREYNGKGVLFQSYHPRTILCGGATQQQQQPQPPSVTQVCPATVGQMSSPFLVAQQTTSATSVSSGS
jgi:hypothetical protein